MHFIWRRSIKIIYSSIIAFALIFAFSTTEAQQKTELFSDDLFKKVQDIYGNQVSTSVANWRKLVEGLADDDVNEKLYQINKFFNRFDFVDDITLWRQKDYWATPIEFIAKGAGDCEDYSIAKYFSLIELGIPKSQLRLMYVTALELNQPHMVLAYYPSPTSVPLVLDNINRRILPANQRRDLAPVYSFNGDGLWAAKSMGTGRKLRGSGPMKMWDDMIDRLNSVMLGDTQEQ